jgi:hypothetical protein
MLKILRLVRRAYKQGRSLSPDERERYKDRVSAIRTLVQELGGRQALQFVEDDAGAADTFTAPASGQARVRTEMLADLQREGAALLVDMTAPASKMVHDSVPRSVHEAWPVSPGARNRSDHKVLGGGPVQAGWSNDIDQLRSKLKAKAGRYGRPEIPFVTAIYCASAFMKDLDIEQALFGREAVLIPPGPSTEAQPIRQRNGFWVRGDGPQNKRVSAVLTAVELMP